MNFTPLQVWTAMAGHGPKPSAWKEVDSYLPDMPIRIMAPPPTSGTPDA